MQAIVFDMDGTLIDSEGIHAAALTEILRPWGIEIGETECVGWADVDVIRAALERAGAVDDLSKVADLVERKADVMARWIGEGRARAYEGAAEAVRSAARRARTAVCSAGAEREVRASLGVLGVEMCAEFVVARDHVVYTKPDPACYALVCERFGIDCASIWAIEDSIAGVTAARAAGLKVVAVGHTTARERLGEVELFVDKIADIDFGALLSD